MSISFGKVSYPTDGLLFYLDPANSKNYLLNEVEVLVVGGGGGGSENQYDDGSGGGGGGFVQRVESVSPSTAYTITVGNGGAAGGGGSRGGNSSAFGIIAYGGGGGSSHRSGDGGQTTGASGGGSGGQYSADTPVVGRAIYGDQGNDGGFSITYGGGGGGGAGTAGQGSIVYGHGGYGGRGRPSSISGTLRYYSGGGGGFGYANNGVGGLGGGGAPGVGAVANTGSGGGGGKTTSNRATNGATGIVIIRYPGPQKATGGNTITQINGHTIHIFTSSGTFTTLGFPTNGASVYGLYDLSNNLNMAYTLGASSAPTYSTSNGGVLTFDGSDDILQIRRSPNLLNLRAGLGGNGLTVLFWARSTNAAGNWRKFFGNDDGDNYVDLYQNPSGYFHQECAATLYVDGSQVSQGAFLTANNGYHFYGATNYNSTNGSITNPSRDFGIGHEPDQARAYAFSMNLGPMFMYNKVLSLSEINQVFNATRGRFGV